MQKRFLVLVLMFFAMGSAVWAECGKFCDRAWWKIATASDVQAELNAGADVNARDEGGRTPLQNAASRGTAESIKLLIAAGADITARDKGGYRPLHLAARWGNAEKVQLLIAAGADITARDEDGYTPLHSAAWGDTLETIEALIAAGADITAKTEHGHRVWDVAQINHKLAGTEIRWSLAKALGKCSRWCDANWWETATAADLQALLDAGFYNKLSKQDRATAWSLAKSSPLKGSKAYWALNDARFK